MGLLSMAARPVQPLDSDRPQSSSSAFNGAVSGGGVGSSLASKPVSDVLPERWTSGECYPHIIWGSHEEVTSSSSSVSAHSIEAVPRILVGTEYVPIQYDLESSCSSSSQPKK